MDREDLMDREKMSKSECLPERLFCHSERPQCHSERSEEPTARHAPTPDRRPSNLSVPMSFHHSAPLSFHHSAPLSFRAKPRNLRRWLAVAARTAPPRPHFTPGIDHPGHTCSEIPRRLSVISSPDLIRNPGARRGYHLTAVANPHGPPSTNRRSGPDPESRGAAPRRYRVHLTLAANDSGRAGHHRCG